jgi:hypothetical protein
MRQYPIWNVVHGQGKKSSANFGSNEGFRQFVLVGSSSHNSHTLPNIEVERRALRDEPGAVEFTLSVDGVVVKRGILRGRDFTIVE